MLKVAVVGACGRMGQEVVRAVSGAQDMELVGACDRTSDGATTQSLLGGTVTSLDIGNKLGAMLESSTPDVLVEFTHHASATDHTLSALKRGVAVVIGTSGISSEDQRTIKLAADEYGAPVLLVPNFALGAVMMMRFAATAAKYFPDAEVIEMHHEQKLDAPSGTAWHTAEQIAAARERSGYRAIGAVEKAKGARGGDVSGVQVHSVRLPGFVASQEVLFGGPGERLSIRHDSMDRASFMAGVLLAVRKVKELNGFHVGLDKLMDF
ncbi:MAG: 4-hydroxy-tetrahydrodipicolinate reductase [Fimbriimonadaceae bacterium]|nr:MAG: 4-hydroxy-tetrahydrodipicolinate reductase [Fimbriimonadaceae bacterium]